MARGLASVSGILYYIWLWHWLCVAWALALALALVMGPRVHSRWRPTNNQGFEFESYWSGTRVLE